MNLWGGELGTELFTLIHAVERDADVRVLVLASADPDFFVAHGDVEGILLIPREPAEPLTAPNVAIVLADRLRTMPKATIAMVAGTARGGGSEIALSCDLRYAGRSARLGQPEVPLGIIPGAGGTQRLSRLVGRARALEIILTGDDYTAEEAAAMGWVNRVLPDDELEPYVRRTARRIASMPAVVDRRRQAGGRCRLARPDARVRDRGDAVPRHPARRRGAAPDAALPRPRRPDPRRRASRARSADRTAGRVVSGRDDDFAGKVAWVAGAARPPGMGRVGCRADGAPRRRRGLRRRGRRRPRDRPGLRGLAGSARGDGGAGARRGPSGPRAARRPHRRRRGRRIGAGDRRRARSGRRVLQPVRRHGPAARHVQAGGPRVRQLAPHDRRQPHRDVPRVPRLRPADDRAGERRRDREPGVVSRCDR